MRPLVSRVSFIPAAASELDAGLVGWISFDLDEALRVDGVALRRRLDNELALSFPCRRGRAGDTHPYLRPLDAQARAAIEGQVLAALGLDQGAP